MGAKLASRNTGMAKEVKPELTDKQKIQEVRNLRSGNLAILNGTYVDALLRAYDTELAANVISDHVCNEGAAKIEELQRELASVKTQADDAFSALTDSQREVERLQSALLNTQSALAASLSTPAAISEDAPNASETGLTALPQTDSIGQ